jgi:DNA-binding transcriptional MerR regulator
LTFTTPQAAAISHLSQRQLHYWRRTQLVTPSDSSPGGHARYTFVDLIIIRAIKQLLDAGVSVQRVRRSIARLRQLLPSITTPLSELTLVANGDVVLVLYQGAVFEAISGQEWIFPVAELLGDCLHLPLGDGSRQQDLFADDLPMSDETAVAR